MTLKLSSARGWGLHPHPSCRSVSPLGLTTSNVPGATIKLSMTLLILVTSERMEAWGGIGEGWRYRPSSTTANILIQHRDT